MERNDKRHRAPDKKSALVPEARDTSVSQFAARGCNARLLGRKETGQPSDGLKATGSPEEASAGRSLAPRDLNG
jgi:hypothetical protein